MTVPTECCRRFLWINLVPHHVCKQRWMQPHIDWLEKETSK